MTDDSKHVNIFDQLGSSGRLRVFRHRVAGPVRLDVQREPHLRISERIGMTYHPILKLA